MEHKLFFVTARRVFLALVLALAAPWGYADDADTYVVTFRLYAPQAKSVELVGDFNQWQSGVTPLAGPDETGIWWVTLTLPETLSRIEYSYWVDGARVVDTSQPIVSDGFSGENNVLFRP